MALYPELERNLPEARASDFVGKDLARAWDDLEETRGLKYVLEDLYRLREILEVAAKAGVRWRLVLDF